MAARCFFLHVWPFASVLLAALASPVSYVTGPFTVHYDATQAPTLRITTGNSLVWFTSSTNKTFVTAARVEQTLRQNGGTFIFATSVRQVCSEMNITRCGSRSYNNSAYKQVYFGGLLCEEVEFEMWLLAVAIDNKATPTTHLIFNLSMANTSPSYNQLRLTYGCERDERVYGFGAQYSKFDMKGERVPLFLSEQGVGRGLEPLTFILDEASPGTGGTWYTTYTRVPHYITSYTRSLSLDSLEYTVFDMTRDDVIAIEIQSFTLTGRIITGGSPLEVITSYTAYYGRMSPLPEWVGKGAILGLQGGTMPVLSWLDYVREVWGNVSDVVVGVWLQDWTGQRVFGEDGGRDLPRVGLWWNWEVDESHYKDWTQLTSNLNELGIKVLTYINPLLSNVSQRGTPYCHNYYQEALEEGYAVRNGDGTVWTGYSDSILVDLSNPAAYQWMKEMIVNNMLGTGVCGWMCDFGESLPLDAKLWGGANPHTYHSLYPEVWAQLNRDAVREFGDRRGNNVSGCGQGDIVYFMRSGNSMSPGSTPLFWLGDQTVTWDSHDGLGTVIIAMLTEGLSGYSLTHSDIGGYTAIDLFPLHYVRSKQLLLRWCELAAFTTMYRSHLGTLPTKNYQIYNDTHTLRHFLNMSVVFQSWGFYRTELMEEAELYRWPVVRHMILVYPNNSGVYSEDLRHQFMLGGELLVAPVHERFEDDLEERRVFLPRDVTWVHLWSGVSYKGANRWVTVKAPIGQPPVFYPLGSKVGETFVQNLKRRHLL